MTASRPQLPASSCGQLPRLQMAFRKPRGRGLCPFCCVAQTRTAAIRSRTPRAPRYYSTASLAPNSPRHELEQMLLDIHKQHPSLLHVSRLQLALQGLRQTPGDEPLRVAILGLVRRAQDGGGAAKRVLMALLADPLKDEEAWERHLASHDPTKPLIIRLNGPATTSERPTLKAPGTHLLQEIRISSEHLQLGNIELLLMDVDPFPRLAAGGPAVEEALLVPSVEIAEAADGTTPVTTPVHRTLLVSDGLMGAIDMASLQIEHLHPSIKPAVNMEGICAERLGAQFEVIDAAKAEQAISLFRQTPQNAMEYERLWFASRLPALASWLKAAVHSAGENGKTKPAVRDFIALLLRDAVAAIEEQQSSRLSSGLRPTPPTYFVDKLDGKLADWAQRAHAELQSQLDLAFTSRRWRKLGWWKLFWRVDDVAMLTNETLSQRFLPTSEQELVYLAGRLAELLPEPLQYQQPLSSRESPKDSRSLVSDDPAPAVLPSATEQSSRWPGHIAFTRRYLQNETVPALQALAQRLVSQSVGGSSMATLLGALLYASSSVSTLYEAGAFAALGIVYSLARLQKKWETARDFWEGEVREEGRKAVRGAEESIAHALAGQKEQDKTKEALAELERARDMVTRAQDALARME